MEINISQRGSVGPAAEEQAAISGFDDPQLLDNASHETPNKEFARRRVSDLREHPRQCEYFNDVNDAELQELADNMELNGLDHPIEILRNGTIIAGHQRVRAARLKGWEYIDVVIRYDLEDAGENAVVERLVKDNLLRRHLDEITIARAYRGLKEIEASRPDSERYGHHRGTVRDRVAARLGLDISGRTLDRYEQVLDATREVQDAVSQKRLPMSKALLVCKLTKNQQSEVAARIKAGEEPRKVVDEYRVEPMVNKSKKYQKLLVSLKSAFSDLDGHVDDVVGTLDYAETLEILTDAQALIEELRMAEMEIGQDTTSASDDEELAQ